MHSILRVVRVEGLGSLTSGQQQTNTVLHHICVFVGHAIFVGCGPCGAMVPDLPTEPAPIDPNGEAASPALAKHRIGREVYTLPPPGERLKLIGPWPGGRKTMRRNNDEAAQTFWERCETAIADREVCSLRPLA